MLSVKVFLRVTIFVVWISFSLQSDEKCNVNKWMSFMEKNCQKDNLKSRQRAELTKIQEHIANGKIAISCSLLQKSHKIIMGSTIFDESKFRYVDAREKNENVKQNDINEGENVPHQEYQEKKLKKKELKEKIEIKKDNLEINDTILNQNNLNQIQKGQKKVNSESENLKHVNKKEKKNNQIFNIEEDDKILKKPLKNSKTAKNNKNQIETNDNPALTNFSQIDQILIENNEDNSTVLREELSDMTNTQTGNNDTVIEIDKYLDSERKEKTPGVEKFAKKGKDVNKNIENPLKESYEEQKNSEKPSNLLKMQNKENTNKREIKEKNPKINKSKDEENVKLEMINENEEINHQNLNIKNGNKLLTEKIQTESIRQSKGLKPVIKNNKRLDKQDHDKVEKEEKLNSIKKRKKVVNYIKNKNDKDDGVILLNDQPDNNNLNMNEELIKPDEIESDVLKYKKNLKTHESEIDQNLDIMKNEEIKVIQMKDTKLNKNRVNIEDKGDNDKESKNNNLKKHDEISEKQNSSSDKLREEENETEIDEEEIDKNVLMKPVENLIKTLKENNNIVTSLNSIMEINEKNSNFEDEKENENQTEDSDNIHLNETLNNDNYKEISGNDKQTVSKIEKHIEKPKIENNKDNMNSHINNETFIKMSNNKEKKQINDTFKTNDDNILKVNEKDSENRKKDLVIDKNIVIPRKKDNNKNNKENINNNYKNEIAIDKKNQNSGDKKVSKKLKKEHEKKSVESHVDKEKKHKKLKVKKQKNYFKINEGQIIKNKIIQTKKNEILPIKHINIPFEENLETKTVNNEQNDNYSDEEEQEKIEKGKDIKDAQRINLKQKIPREDEKIYENVNKNLKDINQNDPNVYGNKIENVESPAIKKEIPKKLKIKQKQKIDFKKSKDQIIKEKHIQTKTDEILKIKPNNIHFEENLDMFTIDNEPNAYSNKEQKENKENKENENQEKNKKEGEKEKEINNAQNINLKQELLRKDEEIHENNNKDFNNISKNDPNVEVHKTESEKSHITKEKKPKNLKDKKQKGEIDLNKKKNRIIKEKHVQMKNNKILQVKPNNSDISKVDNEENNINSNEQEKENKENEEKENEKEKMEEEKEEENVNVKEKEIKDAQNIVLNQEVLRENKDIHENENNNQKVINHNDNNVEKNKMEPDSRNPSKVLKENTENEHNILFDKQSQLLNNQKSEQPQSNKNESTKKSNLENENEKISSNKLENNQKEQVIIKNEDFKKNEIYQNTENDENNFIKTKNKSIKTNDEDKEKFIENKSKENKNKFLKKNKKVKLNENEINEMPERTIKRKKDKYTNDDKKLKLDKSTVANEIKKGDNEKTEKKIEKLDKKDSTMKIDHILNNSDKRENKNISENGVVHNNEGKKKESDKENYKPMKLETKELLNKKDDDKIQIFNESEEIFKSDNDLKNNNDIKENQIKKKKKNENENINPDENVNKDENYKRDILTNFAKTSLNEDSVEKLETPTKKDTLKSLENKNENLNTINDDHENANEENSENEDLKVYKNESPINNDTLLDQNSRYNENINNQQQQNESLNEEKNNGNKVSVDSDSRIFNNEKVGLSSKNDNITKTKLYKIKSMEENPIEIQKKDETTNIKNKNPDTYTKGVVENTDSNCKIKEEIIIKKLEDYQNELEKYKKTQKDQSNLLNTRLQNLEKKLKYFSLIEQKNQKHENLIKNLKNKLRKAESKLKRLFMLLSKIYTQLYPNILKKYNQLLYDHYRVNSKDFKDEAMKVLNETVNEAMESFQEKTFKRVLKHLSIFPTNSEMNLKSNIFQGYESEKCKFLKTVQIPISCANNTKTQSRNKNLMELVNEDSILTDCRQVENEQEIFTNVPFGDNNLKVRILCRNKSIVILKRISGFINFTRNWNDYKYGFGEQNNSFWIGLEVLYQLTKINDYNLIVEIKDWENKSFKGVYEQFKVNSELQGYQLTIGNFHGDCGDGLGAHNNSKFSTIDVDNDGVEKKFGGSCSNRFRGGWWYYACYKSNPTGVYYNQGKVDIDRFDGISWKPLRPPTYSFQQIIMSIQRN